jgi:hypothetical protein
LDQPDGCQEGPFINRPSGWVHSFFGISEDLSLRERCMREICTCSVRGGRRPARKRASSDPTVLPVAEEQGVCSGSLKRKRDTFLPLLEHAIAYLHEFRVRFNVGLQIL